MEQFEGFFEGDEGNALYFQTWEVPNPRAFVLVTHGHGEHSGCYQRLADALVKEQITVCAWDLRGHGRSDGKRGYVNEFSDYISDHHLFVRFFEPQIGGKPFFLLGHSMGGLINLRSVLSAGSFGANSMILSSPLLGLALKVPTVKEKAAKVLGRWMPKVTLNNEISNNWLTHDKDVLHEYTTDTYRHQKISPNAFSGIVDSFEYVNSGKQNLTLPMLVQISGKDKVVSSDATREFCESLSISVDLKVYQNSHHEIFNDLERDQVFNDMGEFITAQLEEQ